MVGALDYTQALKGDDLKIWFPERGFPAYFEGMFGENGRTRSGAWDFPEGGGYEVTGINQPGGGRGITWRGAQGARATPACPGCERSIVRRWEESRLVRN
jgi:hypothetical protein